MSDRTIFFRHFSILLGPILSLGIFFALCGEVGAKEIIRVLILRDVPFCQVTGQELVLRDLATGQTFFHNKKISSLTIEREGSSRLKVRGQAITGRAFLVTSNHGPMGINGRRYRDKLHILLGQNGYVWVVNELGLEDYLVGLINCEISSQWPAEALKAQAIAARTYAVFQRENRQDWLYDLDSGVADQVYKGVGQEDALSRQAVKRTEGELLLYQGNPIFSVYHSCCGGKTESPESLWVGSFPYLKSAACPYCLDSPHFLWNYRMDSKDLIKFVGGMGVAPFRVLGMELGERSESRRVLRLVIKGERTQMEISGKEFRRLIGYDLLRSTNFVVKENHGSFLFSGLGWGHGVGLCQWGAKGMAETGADYRSILKYYYRDVTIGKRAK